MKNQEAINQSKMFVRGWVVIAILTALLTSIL